MRLKLAAAAKLPPYVIAQDRTLVELAEKRPANEAALHDITGLGASKIARYGKAFLETIAALQAEPAARQQRLSATVNQTLAAHLRGLDAEAIAAERKLDVSTIYGHFAEAIEAGLLEARRGAARWTKPRWTKSSRRSSAATRSTAASSAPRTPRSKAATTTAS